MELSHARLVATKRAGPYLRGSQSLNEFKCTRPRTFEISSNLPSQYDVSIQLMSSQGTHALCSLLPPFSSTLLAWSSVWRSEFRFCQAYGLEKCN
eukprot:1562189-Amphidinium_carterae.1